MTTTKFFRVATEGATTDGRAIDRATIVAIAKTFNPQTYGARIWLEHIRGTVPDSVFKAYGDVVSVKAEEVDTDLGKKMALFAQLSPTPDLVAMSKARQKIYTSLEINPKFADTGLPYLVGLGITDSPASLGTEVLTFAANKGADSPFASRKQNPENLYTEAVEVNLEIEEKNSDSESGSLTATLKNLFKKITSTDAAQDARFTELSAALETVANHVVAGENKQQEQLSRLAKLELDFNAFKTQMDAQDSNLNHRPAATGGTGIQQTEF